MKRSLAAISAGLAASAAAQTPSFTSDSTISMPLSWSEVNGNNNGVLEPGESAAIRMNVSFTNQFGVAHFAPSVGTWSSGTILGLGSGVIDLDGVGGTAGTFALGNNPPPQTNNGTTGYGVRSGWRMVGNASPGSVNAAGTGIAQITFGQSPQLPEFANTMNPVLRVYAFLWTPGEYSPRTVTFSGQGHAQPAIATLYIDLNGSNAVYVYVDPGNFRFESVNIPIVPALPTLPLLASGALIADRRRRETQR